MTEITRELAAKVLEIVDAGLSKGAGVAKPGEMCVEAAVCFALGLPHSDDPPCVGRGVRAVKMGVNDAIRGTNAERARIMRRVSIAQLGSDVLEEREFAKRMWD